MGRYLVALVLGLSGCRPVHSGSGDRCAFRADEGTTDTKGLAFEELEKNPEAFEDQRVRVRGRLRGVSAYKCLSEPREGPFIDPENDIPKLELATCSSSYGRHGERYGLTLSAMHALECDGRMVSISGTVRKGALVRVTAIEPE